MSATDVAEFLGESGFRRKVEVQAGPVGARWLVEKEGGRERRFADVVPSTDGGILSELCYNAAGARDFEWHDGVVNAVSTGWIDDSAYYQVLDLSLDARPLADMGSLVQLDERQLWPVAAGLVGAVRQLHRKELVHCAIAPQTIYWQGEGVRLGEWWWLHSADGNPVNEGLAAFLPEGWPEFAFPYMAPELLNGERPRRESDIYSLGALFFYFLTCQPPRAVEELAAGERTRTNITSLRTHALRKLVPTVSGEGAGIIHAMLAENWWERPSVFELEAAFRHMTELPKSR